MCNKNNIIVILVKYRNFKAIPSRSTSSPGRYASIDNHIHSEVNMRENSNNSVGEIEAGSECTDLNMFDIRSDVENDEADGGNGGLNDDGDDDEDGNDGGNDDEEDGNNDGEDGNDGGNNDEEDGYGNDGGNDDGED